MKTIPLSLMVPGTPVPGNVGPRRRKLTVKDILCVPLLLILVVPAPSALGASSASEPRAFANGFRGAEVELNGARMTSGETLYPGDVVKLGSASTVTLQFGKNVVLAVPQTELVIEAEGVTLRSGRLQIRANGGELFAVSGPFFRTNIAPSGAVPGYAEIAVGGNHAEISTVTGISNVVVVGNAMPYEVRAGEMATLDVSDSESAPGQAAPGPAAGKMSRLLPEVQIERASQQLIATLSSPVYWNDDLHSGPTGRAHVTLTDGSLLSLGSNSSLRILQHDAQAQQSALDLIIGRMRGHVMKLTRPGAKFEIRTPVGVAGLVGTDFSLLVADDYTELMVFEGTVRFTIFANGQAINVNAGQKLRIPRNANVLGPLPANPEEIQFVENLTDIPGKPEGTLTKKKESKKPIIVMIAVGGATVAVVSPILARREHPLLSPASPSGPTK